MNRIMLVISAFIAIAYMADTTLALDDGSLADYQRANSLELTSRNTIFRWRVQPHWFDGGDQFWYRFDLARGEREYVVVNAVAGTRRTAFLASDLADEMSKVAHRRLSAQDILLDPINFSKDDQFAYFDKFGQLWRYDLTHKTLGQWKGQTNSATLPVPPVEESRQVIPRPDFRSPDGKWEARIQDGNLFLRSANGRNEVRLSSNGKPDDGYDGDFFWSPDSSHLVAMWTKDGDHRKVYLVQSSPPNQLQPKLLSYDYLKPGDQIPLTKPHLFDINGRKEIPVSDHLFPNPWSDEDVRWQPDSSSFLFVYNQRGHQVLRVISVNAATGEAKAIVDEHSKTFIDYADKFFVHYLDQSHELIWMSERDGWNHLYLYDAQTGRIKNQITRGNWVVRDVQRVDDDKRQIWFTAGGIYPDQDPYYIHYCRVNFDGTGLVIETRGDGSHTVEYSPDRRFLIDSYSRVDLPPVTELRKVADGSLLCPLEQADITALVKTGWKPPERFVAKGRDGTTDIYGLIFRPRDFDPNRKYPVLEDIYAGPQGAFVPKEFSRHHPQETMAELGFIVVKLDGMGTNFRSRAFHDICYKNLGDAGFPDRIMWMKAAAAKYPQMDLSRVGVYGTSAGGQSALRALEAYGEFYKAAVADCGCHDNRMDKIWWNELWMGWPITPEYAQQSNVTNAWRVNGKLLLIVGELDHNVDPASTMQVVNALIKADKDFDLLVIPNADHGQDGPYGIRRRQDFFVRNLLGVEPRHPS
jgi:dipeptidyl-peptidase-4